MNSCTYIKLPLPSLYHMTTMSPRMMLLRYKVCHVPKAIVQQHTVFSFLASVTTELKNIISCSKPLLIHQYIGFPSMHKPFIHSFTFSYHFFFPFIPKLFLWKSLMRQFVWPLCDPACHQEYLFSKCLPPSSFPFI